MTPSSAASCDCVTPAVKQMFGGSADELAKGIYRSRHKTTESGRVVDPLAGTRPPPRRNRHVRRDDETRIKRVAEAYREAFDRGK